MAFYTNREKHDELVREVKMREHVYRRRVEAGQMSGEDARRKIDLMQEIAEDYRVIAEQRELPL